MHLNLRTRSLACGLLTFALVGAGIGASPTAQAYDDPPVIDGMVLDDNGKSIVDDVEHSVLAPGLDHVKFERLSSSGWLQVNVLRAKLSDQTVKAGYLGPEYVAGRGTVSEFSDKAGALAGINGDFFDINNSYAPVGPAISEVDGLLKSGTPGRNTAVTFGADGLGRITQIMLSGTVTTESQTLQIDGLNLHGATDGGISLYNNLWGDYSRSRILQPGETGVEVIVDAGGTVTGVSTKPGSGVLAEGTQAIVARPGAKADHLKTLKVGDQVSVKFGLNEEAKDILVAVGGQADGEIQLLKDGVVSSGDTEYNTVLNPRTAVGFDEDGDTTYFVVVDGRQATSVGMTLPQLGQLMKDLGADDALNLDGGGSSQLNTRLPGDPNTTVQNNPSDGFERSDANGLGLFLAKPGSGNLTGFDVGVINEGEDADRVFPGLTRKLQAKGHDETLSSVKSAPKTWESSQASIASVSDGLVKGIAPGKSTITADNSITGGQEITVLGELNAISADATVLNLEAKDATSRIRITGSDREGFSAPIEPADVEISNDNPAVFSVDALDDGTFEVKATGTEGVATLDFKVGELSTQVAVTVPLELKVIDDFSDIGGWYSAHDRAPGGSVSITEGYEGAGGLRVTYDFTQSTGTRGQYAVAPGTGIELPGRPQKLSVWIKGDGNGSLLRLQVLQANGIRSWLDGAEGSVYATHTGWKRIDFRVPETMEFPLKFERIRALETTAVKQYRGELVFSKIEAFLPPEGVKAPVQQNYEDPIVAETGATDQAPLRVAVLSDAQFVARDPESGAVAGARDALQEIVAEDPDLLLINGDFVDEAAPEDFELAKRILDEELAGADFPYYYIPGNHEVMGGKIDNFKAIFGDTAHTFDLAGTRFITLNSATGKLAGDYAQLQLLQQELQKAEKDPAISGVVVATHMPTNDPLPTAASQLSDRNEAAMIDSWLQEFRANSGKQIAFVGSHVGVFDVTRIDGVPYLINGNSGKSPSSTPANGGFTGWSMLGINPEAGKATRAAAGSADWLQIEINSRVEKLELAVPESIKVGSEAVAIGTVSQDSGARVFEVNWPVSHTWSGSENLFIGSPEDAPEGTVAALDPATGNLVGLSAGTVDIKLSVNDQQVSRTVTIVADPSSPEPTAPTSPEPTDPTSPEPTGPTSPEPTNPTTPEPTNPVTPKPTSPTAPAPTDSTSEPSSSIAPKPSSPGPVVTVTPKPDKPRPGLPATGTSINA